MELTIRTRERDIENLLEYADKLQEVGKKYSINPFQPGLIKELKIAKILGHDVTYGSKQSDAVDKDGKFYEYITSLKGGYIQIDDVYKDDESDPEQHKKYLKSISNINRNEAYYIAYMDGITPVEIYEIPTRILIAKIDDLLEKSKVSVSHVNIPEKWVKLNGHLTYTKSEEKHSWFWRLFH